MPYFQSKIGNKTQIFALKMKLDFSVIFEHCVNHRQKICTKIHEFSKTLDKKS